MAMMLSYDEGGFFDLLCEEHGLVEKYCGVVYFFQVEEDTDNHLESFHG